MRHLFAIWGMVDVILVLVWMLLPREPAPIRRELPRNLAAEPAYPGLDTVVFSIMAPDLTVHSATARCPIEGPHKTAECGEWEYR